MVTCTFAGHRKIEDSEVELKLKEAVADMVFNKHVDTFYIGGNGEFDYLAAKAVNEVRELAPYIKSYLVLAYDAPDMRQKASLGLYDGVIIPEIDRGILKYAIIRRNQWMIDKSKYVICYIRQNIGGAWLTHSYAKKKDIEIIMV